MSTLVNERTSTEAPRGDFRTFFEFLLKAFGPVANKERSRQDDRALRRELWMLGGG